MSNINKAAVLNPLHALIDNIVDYVPRATTSKFGVVAIGSGINVDSFGRIYLDTQEYSDRLTAIEDQAASTLATQKSEVAAAIAQVNLAQSQTITALTLEVSNLKTNLTESITTTQTELINRADQLAQDVQLSLDAKVNKSDVIAIAKGGTGATTAAAARTNLELGTAASKNVGTQVGNVMGVGAFGVGNFNRSYSIITKPSEIPRGLSLAAMTTDLLDIASKASWQVAAVLNLKAWDSSLLSGAQAQIAICGPAVFLRAGHSLDSSDVFDGGWINFYTNRNTTTDSNGFVKAASPIVKLFADKIELNDEAKLQSITFEKLGIGDYLIKNSSGFAQSGWYVEQPKDANGNVYHAVAYEQFENGDISVKTFEQKLEGTRIVADLEKPLDIKENRFISIRLNELPQDTTAPQNPNIVDNEGNPAPSRLHELVNGVWVISDENAAILEQERLSAMPAMTRRQFRLALVLNGYNLADIETLINSIEDQMQRTIAQIEWQDATDFERTNPTLLMMADLLQLTSEQVDQLWSYGLAL